MVCRSENLLKQDFTPAARIRSAGDITYLRTGEAGFIPAVVIDSGRGRHWLVDAFAMTAQLPKYACYRWRCGGVNVRKCHRAYRQSAGSVLFNGLPELLKRHNLREV